MIDIYYKFYVQRLHDIYILHTADMRTSQIVNMPWIADKTISSKRYIIFVAVNLHKKHFTGSYEKTVEVLDELQDAILKGRRINKLWQKLFDQY